MVEKLYWKIFFANGDTLTNLETTRAEDGRLSFDQDGVGAIVNILYNENGGARWVMAFGRNYYCLLAGGKEWNAATFPGLINYLADHKGNAAVLRGKMIPNKEWEDLQIRIQTDDQIFSVTRGDRARQDKDND